MIRCSSGVHGRTTIGSRAAALCGVHRTFGRRLMSCTTMSPAVAPTHLWIARQSFSFTSTHSQGFGGATRHTLMEATTFTKPGLGKPTIDDMDPPDGSKRASQDLADDDHLPTKSAEHIAIETTLQEIKETYLKPYDTTFKFVSDATYTVPMVMMLGNHSSGKSTLINYLVGRDVQQTGVAPTDDGFTVIQRGSFDMNDDGPTAVMNPRYKFESLQSFGYRFVNHFRVKTRVMPRTSKVPRNMLLVDTPGMIDTPIHVADRTTAEGQLRGYDFLAATRWFAQRSDVILLMFDPSNPGTTGETLDVLTKSLTGLEHKFLLVMNKVDMFEKVGDFARAYGALCWNLSKVIKMKDMPRIYTTCTPRPGGTSSMKSPTVVPEEEIDRQRTEIIDEILSAPLSRLDNLVTETEDSAKCLYLSAQVSAGIRRSYRQREISLLLGIVSGCLLAPLLVMGLSSVSLSATVLVVLLTIVGGCSGVMGSRLHLQQYELDLLANCDSVVDRLYPGKGRTMDLDTRWMEVVKPEISRLVHAHRAEGRCGVTALPATSQRAMRQIKSVIDKELPALRLHVSLCKEEGCKQLRKREKMERKA